MTEMIEIMSHLLVTGGLCILLLFLQKYDWRYLVCSAYAIAAGLINLVGDFPGRPVILLVMTIFGAAYAHWEYDQTTASRDS